ncbi:MFS transporter [Rhodovibrio salinarum]|uniref:MFS transporter n=2 Tax=Rhodovibrio salinarum TaxID=1087 RepID=A0A934V0I9_9PROT|nr:MFS transporter [Rhodovibrio salinarum]
MLGWLGIIRLGLVQTALGAIVVLTTSTLNRVMVVELALPAVLPGLLVGWHYAVQMSRPRMGYGSDVGQRRTPWIIGGMAVLALGGLGAATAVALMSVHTWPGVALGLLAFTLIGAGVGASGTSLLTLLAKRVDPTRRAPAAATVWIMMIAGFVVTATTAGQFLDPYSHLRLVVVTGTVCAFAFVLTVVAVWRLEGPGDPVAAAAAAQRAEKGHFWQAFKQIWGETQARRFTVFVFVSMLAYSAQDLILEPFAGAVFEMTPGQSTQLSGTQHGGVLVGMLLVAVSGMVLKNKIGSLRTWAIGGCIASAIALLGLVVGGLIGPAYPLTANVVFLGAANGAFAVAAIGSMMSLAGQGQQQREGTRMGLWGASQAVAFGLGGLLGTVAIDVTRMITDQVAVAYGAVFASQAALFLIAAVLAARIDKTGAASRTVGLSPAAEGYATGVGS